MTEIQIPGAALREARQRDSRSKRTRVFATVDEMKRAEAPITFASVARAANVSTWLVYAEGVREYIEAARLHQASTPAKKVAAGLAASTASLRTDLELARQDNRRLRAELNRLNVALREQLGQQLEYQSVHHLRARIDELTRVNDKLRSENLLHAAEIAELRSNLRTSQEDLAAARTSLRRMIRDHTDQI